MKASEKEVIISNNVFSPPPQISKSPRKQYIIIWKPWAVTLVFENTFTTNL